MNSRRDLLKLFGVGALVAPVIKGIPSVESVALIVTPPTIEIPPPPKVQAFAAMPDFMDSDVVVFARDRKTGSVMRMECRAFLTEWKHEMIDISSHSIDPRFREFVPAQTTVTFTATGEAKIVGA